MFRSWQTIRSIPRLREIFVVIAKNGFGHFLSHLKLPVATQVINFFRKKQPAPPLSQPQRLRQTFEELGPTFIKFGQILATRPDAIPPDYISELHKLHDYIEPAPFEQLEDVFQKELGRPPEECFKWIDKTPIGSASIAQVYKARTFDDADVVIKIQRPGIRRIIERDIQILKLLAGALSHVEELAHFDLDAIVGVFERSILRELDFRYERHNMETIERTCTSSIVLIPKTFPELSSRQIFTMERIPGPKLKQGTFTEAQGKKAAQEFARTMFEQIFIYGVFHADPHPGNIILTPGGRVGLFDFGSIGRLSPGSLHELAGLLTSIIKRNYRLLARRILRSGYATGEIDLRELSTKLLNVIDPYYDLPLSEIEIGPLLNDTFKILYEYKIRIPEQYVLLARALMILEGTLHQLNPSMCLIDHLKPLAKKIIMEQWKPEGILRELRLELYDLTTTLWDLPAAAGELLERLRKGSFRARIAIEDIQGIERRLDRLNLHVPLGILASSILISGTLILVLQPDAGYCIPAAVASYSLAALLGLWVIKPKR